MNGLVIQGGPLGVTPFHMPFEALLLFRMKLIFE